MKRPTINDEMKLAAAKEVAEKLDCCDAETIAKYYQHGMNGYELARGLDKFTLWSDFTMDDVEQLDTMWSAVSEQLRKAEKEWFEKYQIKPPLPDGTKINEGVIHSVDPYGAATYLVKENDCTLDNRFLVINFEDAVAVSPTKGIEQ